VLQKSSQRVYLALAFIFVLQFGFNGYSESHEKIKRVVRVKIAADKEFSLREMHRVEFQRLVRDVGLIFRSHFNIHLKVKEFVYWDYDKSCNSIFDLLHDLKKNILSSDMEIVIGIISVDEDKITPLGISSYLDGYVLLKNLKSKKSAMKFVLTHELLHLFGAIDICEPNSFMSMKNPRFKIDEFTKKIVKVNKFRVFRPGVFPLSTDNIIDAKSLYRERAKKNLGEIQLSIILNHLHSVDQDKDTLEKPTERDYF
jgi:hypothetical protein